MRTKICNERDFFIKNKSKILKIYKNSKKVIYPVILLA